MAKRRDGKTLPSEVVKVENLLLNLKQRTKRKLEDCDPGVESHYSWDRDAFFQRVQTFSITTWFGKPEGLSPLQCAKYGWRNTESDMLQCGVCRAVICATLPFNYDPKIYKTCVKNLMDRLKSGHEQACKWRSNPTPDSVLQIPMDNKEEIITEFNKRLQSLLPSRSKLPYINMATIESQGVTNATLTALAENLINGAIGKGIDDLEFIRKASIISLCGWKNRSDDVEDILSCDFCRRNIGLWNYKSPYWHQTHDTSEQDTTENSEQDTTEHSDQTETIERVTEIDKTAEGVQDSCTDRDNDNNGHENSGENKISVSVQESSAEVNQTESESNIVQNGALVKDKENKDQDSCNEKINESKMEMHSDHTEDMTKTDNNGTEDACMNKGDSDCSEVSKPDVDIQSAKDSTDMEALQARDTNDLDGDDSAKPFNSELGHDSKNAIVDKEKVENGGHISEGEAIQDSVSETVTESTEGMKSSLNAELSNDNSKEEKGTKEDNSSNTTQEQTDEPKSPVRPSSSTQINCTSDTEERPRKRVKLEEKDSFDPLAEHRTWCPWLQKSCDTSPWKQSGSDGMLPWRKILYIVCPSLKEGGDETSLSYQYKQVSPVAALQRVCRILNDWTRTESKN
ncbi:uncharacterized protein LOC133175981 [Saccostrea echinata]|uniref:uncharacterized protein LOC133175981 n=1 Tax=Saccostrea echinata TaxID=191078 RepID=UPI002A82FC58|nr:uncharacterized protein LOC133175981 [Saccostrea echinata]